MASYDINATTLSKDELRFLFNDAINQYSNFDWHDLRLIFEVAIDALGNFPNINSTVDEQTYINKWVKGYYDAMNNIPSQRIATPKSSCSDPAIRVIVQASKQQSDDASFQAEEIHNLFMSAENIQGSLLEEYIASHIREYGFLWCNGNVLRSIDFCNTNGSYLLQIKNKNNTENSSSSSVRSGTDIKKWFRLGTKTREGVRYPDYKWEILNDIISEHRTEGLDLSIPFMNEADYIEFLVEVSNLNTQLITEK